MSSTPPLSDHLLSLPAHSPEQWEATGAGLPLLWPLTALRTAWVQLCLPGWMPEGGGSKSAGSYRFTSFGAQNNFLALPALEEALFLIIHVPPLQLFLAAERKGRASRKEQGGSRWSAEPLRGCSFTASHPNHAQLARQLGSGMARAPSTSPGHPRFTCMCHFGVSPSLKRAPAAFKAVLLFVKTYLCFVHKTKPTLKITLVIQPNSVHVGVVKVGVNTVLCEHATHIGRESFRGGCEHISKWNINKSSYS